MTSCSSGSAHPAGSGGSEQTDSSLPAVEQSSTGSLRLDLVDYPVFQEGFDYGVRLEADGAILEERLLPEFEGGDQARVQGLAWSADFEVPIGSVTVLSDLTRSAAGAPPPPDFSDPCRSDVTVQPSAETRLVLDWTSGCVEVVD